MRNTVTFGWSIPPPGAVPYQAPARDLVHAIDASVNSVEQLPGLAFMQLVLSAYPTAQSVFSGTGVTAWPAGSGWTTVSIAPVGAYVASFAMPLGNQRALLDVRMLHPCSPSPVLYTLQYRGILNPGSLTLGEAGSEYLLDRWDRAFVHTRYIMTTPPLSSTNYSLTLQIRTVDGNVRLGPSGYVVAVLRMIAG